MGMDYSYAGSASYPRFDCELCAVAEVFGGVKTEHLKEHARQMEAERLEPLFGFFSSDTPGTQKFAFPKGTDEVLIKWFNNPYGDFNMEETRKIWEHVSKHPEIKEISYQIWFELETLILYDEEWGIY